MRGFFFVLTDLRLKKKEVEKLYKYLDLGLCRVEHEGDNDNNRSWIP